MYTSNEVLRAQCVRRALPAAGAPLLQPDLLRRCSMSATSRRNRSIDSRVVSSKGLGRYIGSKEFAMQTTRFERMALARIFVGGWGGLFRVTNPHAPPPY